MTRRDFISVASAGILSSTVQPPLTVPLHLVLDGQAKIHPLRLHRFWSRIWPQAVREFAGCGIRFQCTRTTGSVERPENSEPIVSGLCPTALNLVVTGGIPMEWDRGLALSGVTTRYRGFHLCMVALYHAHANQVPLLSVNTCVHELLHALLLDIFENRPAGLSGAWRESRIDWHATLLWLLGDDRAIRNGAQAYLEKAAFSVTNEPKSPATPLP